MLCTACPPLGTQSENLNDVQVVAQRLKVIGYDRELFGNGWAVDPNTGCTSREQTISTQLIPQSDSACDAPAAGTCPYSGKPIATDSGNPDVESIEVDHIFPLAAAWDMGAFAWSEEKRVAFANDPANLIAVSASANRQKSDLLPSEWLPPKRSKRCWYVNQVADIAVKYELALPATDIAVMQRQCLFR